MQSEFYDLLCENEHFCKALGRATLAASKLEIELKQYLRLHGKEVSEKKATLGNLIKLLIDNDHLTNNGKTHLGQVNQQRNYLVHNLYGSLVGEIKNWLLPVNGLISEDVEVYVEKTNLMVDNLNFYSEIVCRALLKNNNSEKGIISISPLL